VWGRRDPMAALRAGPPGISRLTACLISFPLLFFSDSLAGVSSIVLNGKPIHS